MAVSVDNVYQKVLALANKESRGYITPQEFNLHADRAQNEIFNNYFHRIKMTSVKPKEQVLYGDELEIIEEKLQPFYSTASVFTNTTSNNLTLPTNLYRLISVTALSDNRGSGNKLTQLNKSEVEYTENSSLTKAVLTRSVFFRNSSNTISILPTPSATTYNVDSDSDGTNDAESFSVHYYVAPSRPNWTYVMVASKALYNSSAQDHNHFDLHESEEENLVSRILMLSGVTIQKPDIQQAGATDINLTRQQQNS